MGRPVSSSFGPLAGILRHGDRGCWHLGTVRAIELARAGLEDDLIEAHHVGAGASGGSLGILLTPAAGAGFGDPDEFVHGRPRKAWHRERLAAQNYLLRLIEESMRLLDPLGKSRLH